MVPKDKVEAMTGHLSRIVESAQPTAPWQWVKPCVAFARCPVLVRLRVAASPCSAPPGDSGPMTFRKRGIPRWCLFQVCSTTAYSSNHHPVHQMTTTR
jgi:hypothetical protein